MILENNTVRLHEGQTTALLGEPAAVTLRPEVSENGSRFAQGVWNSIRADLVDWEQ
jgi:hypothetical protein